MITTNKAMTTGHSHNLPQGYKGTAKSVISPGDGARYANPFLTVISSLNYAPEGLDLVSSPSIIVGLDEKGYTVPSDGKILPNGIIDECLRGTSTLFKGVKKDNLGNYSSIPSLTNGQLTGMEEIKAITPTIYQAEALFERGYAYKVNGASKDIFEFKAGDLIRAITTEEIDAAIADETLPILIETETKDSCPRTKAWYAGMPVKFDGTKDNVVQAVGRIASIVNPKRYDNAIYSEGWCFDYALQGPATRGQSRNVWCSIGAVFDDKNYKKIIVEFYVTM